MFTSNIQMELLAKALAKRISESDTKIKEWFSLFKTTLTINFEYQYTQNELLQINQNINTVIFDEREEDEILQSLIIDNDTMNLHKGSTSWGRGDNTKKALGTVAEFSGAWLDFLRSSDSDLDYPPFIIVGNSPPSSIWLKKLKNSTLIGDGNFLTEIWELSPTAENSGNYLAIRNENNLLERLSKFQ